MTKDTYIEDKLLEDIKAYCELNGLKPAILINGMVQNAFMKLKWGNKPSDFWVKTSTPEDTTKPVEVEKVPEQQVTPQIKKDDLYDE